MIRIACIVYIAWLEMLRKKDVYVLLILLGSLLVTLVSLDIFGLGGLVVYVKDVGLLLAWIFAWILAVNVSARSLPTEEQRGTIFPLLAKPITRVELIIGKWLGAWTVVCAATFLFYLLVALVVMARGDPGAVQPSVLLAGYILHTLAIGIICAFTLLLATRMNHDAAAATAAVLSLAAFLVLPRVPAFMVHARGFRAAVFMTLYHLMPHFEFFDYRQRIVHQYGPADWKIFGLVILYGILYTALLLLFAWLAYRKKRFSRGNLV